MNSMRQLFATTLGVTLATIVVVGTSGCAGTGIQQAVTSSLGSGTAQVAQPMQGLVHGGNLPVSGATIQLWAAGTGGYGSSPTPLVSTSNNYYPGGATGCTASTSSITAFSITSNVVTFTAASAIVPPVNSYVTISGLTTSAGTALNGQTLIVTSSSATQFTAAFASSDVGSTTDTGTATEVCSTNVITTYNGGFTLSPSTVKSYSCTAGTMIYITATGGNPGLGQIATTSSTANNTALSMMTALGNCSNLTTSTNITINEVTTIAAVYALQNYIGITPATTLSATLGSGTPAFRIGAGVTTSASYQGLKNAFELATMLANTSTGVAANNYQPIAGGSQYTVEYYQLNMLANVLAGCVNNANGTASGCTSLFTYATPPGGTAGTPADTLEVAYEMAQNPTNNAQNIASLATSQAAFNPYASSVNDLTLGGSVTIQHPATPGYYMYRGYYTAVDGYGNLWVTSTGGIGGGTVQTNLVSEFDPAGQPLGTTHQYNTGSIATPTLATISPNEPTSTTGNYKYPLSMTIDANNNVWIGDFVDSVIIEIPASTGAGVASVGLTTTTSTGAQANNNLAYALTPGSYPATIAADKSGNIYIAEEGNSYGTAAPSGAVTANVPAQIQGLTAASIAQYNYNGSVSKGPLSSATLFTATTGPGQVPSSTASVTLGSVSGTTTYTDQVTGPPSGAANANVGVPLLAMAMDYGSSSAGSPLIWVPDSQGCGGSGQILQIFGAASSTNSPAITQGEATPLSPIGNSTQTTCKSSGTIPILETAVANYTEINYDGGSYTTYSPEKDQAAVIDPGGSVWVLNLAKASAGATPVAYPATSLTKLTPAYTTTSGVLSGTVSAITTVSGAVTNMLGTSAPTNENFAIDSAGNVWISANGSQSVVPETGNTGTYTTASSFVEFNNAGTDISSQYFTGSPSTATATTPAIGSQFGYVGAYPLYSGGALVAASYRPPTARFSVAIDLGGSLWSASGTSSGSTLFFLVGGAAPTLAPIALGNPAKP